MYINNVKYIGHTIDNCLSDNEDVNRQIKSVYIRANMFSRKIAQCNDSVKARLFNSFCTHLYCCNIWCNYTSTAIRNMRTAYNNSFRIFMKLPRF